MGRVAEVNTTDLAGAIRLGCRTMQRVFNADDDHVPFFGSSLRPHAALSFSAHHSESHVPGRHLNALLNAEDAVGVTLDEHAVEHHRRAALLSYSGPVPLPLNRERIGGPLLNFCPHNLREGFHALYALARFRDDRRAAELFEQSVAAIGDLWQPDTGWDLQGLAGLGLQYQECQGFLHGEARMLGPLVKYYRATGHTPALRLALVLAEKALAEFFLPDGEYHPERFITRHSHSITCVLSSLAQLADLLDDAALLGRVRAFCERGLWALRDQLGWSPEAVGQQDTDHGEANNSGDILETALILGRRGYPEYFHDAELLLRGHLLPAQLRDVSFVEEPANPTGADGLHQVGDRHLGAFGFPAPYGHQSIGKGRGNLSFNMDIVGGAVASLCEAHREAVRQAKTGTWVNLLFDHQGPQVRVRSPYTGPGLEIEPLSARPLWVRLPPWTDPAAVQLEGTAQPPVWTRGYLFFAQPVPRQPLRLRFPLPVRELVLSGRVHLHPIRVRLRGDAVVAMDHFGADLTFFDPY